MHLNDNIIPQNNYSFTSFLFHLASYYYNIKKNKKQIGVLISTDPIIEIIIFSAAKLPQDVLLKTTHTEVTNQAL